jgi:hypothetical protein
MDAAAVRRHSVSMATLLVALTRWPALSRTLWDWDEALFALAVRDYDVSAFHPQPPGFPLFIALAKLIPHHDEFHALQAIVFVSSLFVFPAAYWLARELGAPFFVAFASAMLLALMPNVWFYGGTAFSDVPSLVLSIVACALLLRGRRDPRALLAGALVLGIAAAVRPQNLLIAFVPFVLALIAEWSAPPERRGRRARMLVSLAAVLITAIIVLASYGAAAAASGGWSVYRATLAEHAHYIRTTDSFLSPIRPSLVRVADDFFLRPFRAPAINIVFVLLALVALVRRRRYVLLAIATFAPFAIFAWLYLDFHSASRFSVAYMPLFAILAADGIEAAQRVRAFVLAAVAALMVVWTWPALRVVHDTPSPPVAALESVRNDYVFIGNYLGAQAQWFLRDARAAWPEPVATMHTRVRSVLVREGCGAINFTRGRAGLAGIARARYFECSVNPLARITFGEGWYGEEGPPLTPFRWMARRSRALLPPGKRVSLRLALPDRTTIQLFANGKLLERIDAPRGTIERVYAIEGARELVIETSSIAHAPRDPRELGLRLEAMTVTR